jgi:energy-coupling factor transporter transmembrane protein EcfT
MYVVQLIIIIVLVIIVIMIIIIKVVIIILTIVIMVLSRLWIIIFVFIVIIIIVIVAVIIIFIIIVTVCILIFGSTQPSSQARHSGDNTNHDNAHQIKACLRYCCPCCSVPDDDVCVVPEIGNLETFLAMVGCQSVFRGFFLK